MVVVEKIDFVMKCNKKKCNIENQELKNCANATCLKRFMSFAQWGMPYFSKI